MSRMRMVTRTINVSKVKALCINTETCEVSGLELELTGETYTKEKALKDLKKVYDTANLKVVDVKEITVTEEIYGLSEIEFLKVAKKLDPATRKILESED